jgi:pimeloyl-ACP methyl ester carboxylesterase
MPTFYETINVMQINIDSDDRMQRSETQILGDVPVDVHWITTADNTELAVTRIRPRRLKPLLFPAVLVHGTYTNRHFWISPKGVGMGAYLADQGVDVWIPELRGHGLSPKGEAFSAITAQDQIYSDLPAIQDYIFQQTAAPAFWVGHSFGGLFIIAALSAKRLNQDRVKGMVTLGSQISLGDRYLKVPPVAWALSGLLRVIGHLPSPTFGLGPEIEPAGVILETIRWKKLFGKWTDTDGFSYWEGLNNIRVPVLTYAAARDRNDPAEGCRLIHDAYGSADKIFMLLGRINRFSKDYDHVGMVVSREAQTEVWPDIAGWMMDRR